MSKSILIIDDDKKLRDLLGEYLSKHGFTTTGSSSSLDGISLLRSAHFDLIILDIMMPEMDGYEACRVIRKDHDIPIIMLTARGETTDKVVGLELGADDYMPKPFEPRELLARINSVLRRSTAMRTKNEVVRLKGLTVDPNKRTAFSDGADIGLTSSEFELLWLFVKNNGRVISRDEIMKNTRGISWMSFNRSVDVMVSKLRHKLTAIKRKEPLIKTVHSVGYIFYCETQE